MLANISPLARPTFTSSFSFCVQALCRINNLSFSLSLLLLLYVTAHYFILLPLKKLPQWINIDSGRFSTVSKCMIIEVVKVLAFAYSSTIFANVLVSDNPDLSPFVCCCSFCSAECFVNKQLTIAFLWSVNMDKKYWSLLKRSGTKRFCIWDTYKS